MNTYRFMATDLDGTLLNAEHRLSQKTAQTLTQLSKQGVTLTFATGRHFLDAQHLRRSIDGPVYLITANGARIHDPEGNLLYAANLPPVLAKELMQKPWSEGLLTTYYDDDGWKTTEEYLDFELMHDQDSAFKYDIVDTAAHSGEGVIKALYHGKHADLLQLQAKLQAKFNQPTQQLYIVFSHPEFLEVMAAGVSKGNAIEFLLKQLSLSPKDCVAFGDGENDIEMLTLVEKGYVMTPTSTQLDRALPHLPRLGRAEEDSVALELERLFQL
jgi:Cof subfamily protein (haloacid dehalogenase superfamily)